MPLVGRIGTMAGRGGSTAVAFGCAETFQKWLGKGTVDFLEIYCGFGEFTARVREAGMTAGEGIDSKVISYGQVWPLEQEATRAQLAWLIYKGLLPKATHTGTPCTHVPPGRQGRCS